jgi:YrbI family 3-deoxy-D-manno-octulosonate 8-phosphate phosphatase
MRHSAAAGKPMTEEYRPEKVELILSDVDGVLTDGSIVYDNQGIETKSFSIRDGLGIKLWQRAGFRFGILTARSSHIVKLRAGELGVDLLRQGFENKLPTARQIIEEMKLDASQVCYIGDDLPDIPVMRHVGWGVAVADAAAEVRSTAGYVTEKAGGQGAVRETVEVILKAKGLWEDLIRKYTGP